MIIDGNGHTIDAQGKTQIFHITGNNIVLKNIIFKNAFSKNSGAAISNFKKKLTVINCKFINNISSESDGGAICNWNGSLTIKCCNFENNYSKGNGGAIFNGNSMEVFDSDFTNNISKQKGLSIFNNSKSVLFLKNSNFKENSSSDPLNNEIFNRGIINIDNSDKNLYKSLIKWGFFHICSDNVKSFNYLGNLIHSGKKRDIFGLEY